MVVVIVAAWGGEFYVRRSLTLELPQHMLDEEVQLVERVESVMQRELDSAEIRVVHKFHEEVFVDPDLERHRLVPSASLRLPTARRVHFPS